MILFDKNELGKIAKERGFVRDTYEKVLRLAEVLRFLNEEPFLKEHLVLKGGTAINLTIVISECNASNSNQYGFRVKKYGSLQEFLNSYGATLNGMYESRRYVSFLESIGNDIEDACK